MTSNSDSAQQASQITHQSPSQDLKVMSSNETSKVSSQPTESTVKFTTDKTGFSIKFGQSIIVGLVLLGIIATIFLLTRGSQFCLFSDCHTLPDGGGAIAVSFWSMAGGIAAYGIATLIGVELLPAVAIGMGIWFLIQMSLH